jgi:hypothetical protein
VKTGTLAWARRTGGELRFRDRLELLSIAVAHQARVLPAQLWSWLGLPARHPPAYDLAELRPPDSTAARRAEEHLATIAEPFLVNHSIRTYLWSRILARPPGIPFDDELLYVASLLHDAGLVEPHRSATGACFTLRSADAARALTEALGWHPARRDRLAEVITLHVNPRVARSLGAEAHLMNGGVVLDVTGLRLWEVHPELARAVLERLPRLDMKRRLWEIWRCEADAHPRCRGRFANRYLQFGHRVRSAPFDE